MASKSDMPLIGKKVAGDLKTKRAKIGELMKSQSNDRREREKNLVHALSIVLGIIRLMKIGANQNRWRNAITSQIYQAHRDGKIGRVRSGSNPFLPVVKLCMPDLTPAKYNQYSLVLAYWRHRKVKSKDALKQFSSRVNKAWSEIDTDEVSNRRKARKQMAEKSPYTITQMADKGRAIIRKHGWPKLDLDIDWA